MFLTRMALDMTKPETVALTLDGSAIRLAVLSTFAGGNLQPLFRLDAYSSRTWLVMLSRLRPTMNAIHQRFGYMGVFPSWETFDYDDVLENAEVGARWYFELSASPVGLTEDAQAFLDRERLCRWLAEQGPDCGFRLRDTQVMEKNVRFFGEQAMPIARWHGTLDVTDAERFQWAVSTGIGPAVELGIGLMTISQAYTVWD